MRDLLAELTSVLEQGRACVYCSVIETRGSTPQKAGAAMLVFPDGRQIGTLGGGCIEAEVRQRALRTMGQGEAEVQSFCLDDNYGWDDGLICGGRMSILADPLVREGASRDHIVGYYRRYRELMEEGQGCTEAVVMSERIVGVKVGDRYVFDGGGKLVAQLGARPMPPEVSRHLPALPQRPRPCVHQGIAYLPSWRRITLLIVGGGHVGQAVARLAADVDFDIWVLDDRERYASRDRFPMARKLLVSDIGAALKELAPRLTPATFCVIVTRGHSHDEEALFHLATTQAGYVGMIGSNRKKKLIYEDLLAKNIPAAALAKVHSPLGFAIGSQTVPEIAISIVAELIACRNLGTSAASWRGEPRP